MSWFSSFMNPGDAYKKGSKKYEEYFQQAQGFNKPYIRNAQGAYTNINDIMKSLSDPQALQDKWAQGYQESEAAKNARAMSQQHGLDAASSLGLMGSNTALGAIQAGTSQITANDRQQYLDDLMKKYMASAGIGQDIYGTGARASAQNSQNAMNAANAQSQFAYGQQAAPGNQLAGLIGMGVGAYTGRPNAWTTGGR